MSAARRPLQPLARCPWCGGTAFVSGETRSPGGNLTWRGVCLGCGASGPVESTPEQARARWDALVGPVPAVSVEEGAAS